MLSELKMLLVNNETDIEEENEDIDNCHDDHECEIKIPQAFSRRGTWIIVEFKQ